jgi:hypothetical protein
MVERCLVRCQKLWAKQKPVILRKLKKPDCAHSEVQILPFKLNRTRAANGTWKLEPQPNEASRYDASQVHPNSWALLGVIADQSLSSLGKLSQKPRNLEKQ